jgi:hypothetical protein
MQRNIVTLWFVRIASRFHLLGRSLFSKTFVPDSIFGMHRPSAAFSFFHWLGKNQTRVPQPGELGCPRPMSTNLRASGGLPFHNPARSGLPTTRESSGVVEAMFELFRIITSGMPKVRSHRRPAVAQERTSHLSTENHSAYLYSVCGSA